MENKIGKDKNLIAGNFVKKAAKAMRVFSKDVAVVKTDTKLTAKEKENRDKKTVKKAGKK